MNLLKDRPEDTRRYINAWMHFYIVKSGKNLELLSKEERERALHQANAALHSHLYENLTILDTKANVLASSASIFTAALGIILSNSAQHWDKFIVIYLALSTCVSIISVLLVISVVFVAWSTPDQLDEPDLDSLVRHLVDIRNCRTRRYIFAWILHIIVVLSSLSIILLRLSTLI